MAANSADDVLALTHAVSAPAKPQSPTQAAPAVSAGPLFLSASQRDAANDIRRTLAERHVFAAVTGAPGLGKTTVLSAAVAEASQVLGASQVLRVDHPDRVSVEHAEQLVAKASAAPGGHAVLVVDDADQASLSLLRGLTRIADSRLPGAAQVILAGRPELWDRLGAEEFTPLRERIAVRPVLRPMTDDDARGLIRHVLHEPRKIFGQTLADDAEREVLRLANGRPERIGALVRSTLMLSDLQIRPQLTVDMVHATADMLDGRQRPVSKRRVKILRPVLAAGLVLAVTGGLAMAARDGRLERVLSAARDVAGSSATGWMRQVSDTPAVPAESAPARPPEPVLRQVEAVPPAVPAAAQEAERARLDPPPALPVPATPEPVSPEATPPEATPPRGDAPERAPANADASQADATPPETREALAGTAGASSASDSPSPAAENIPREPASDPVPTVEAAMPSQDAPALEAAAPPEPDPALQAVSTSEAASSAAANPDQAPDASTKTLAPGLVAALLRHGDEALVRGDVSAARQFYERATPAGSSLGARGMARTYDPVVLGRSNTAADPKAAAAWYEKAARLDAHPGEHEPSTRDEANAQRLPGTGR